MYNSEFYDPYHYPRNLRTYDMESYHATWHPEDLVRERELEELSLASHELDLELQHLQLERERALALNVPYGYTHMAGIDPGYALVEPYGIGYGGSYPGHAVPHYDPPPIPIVNDPVYHHTTIQPPHYVPHNVPMMDPYFLNHIPNPVPAMPQVPPVTNLRNPFAYGVDHDYGYGAIRPLSQYGLAPAGLRPDYGRVLDDLYLYETLLRLDRTLDEKERLLRWQERLAWEQLDHAERQLLWQQMNMMDRSRLGLGPGSYWGYEIGGVPIDTNFGYLNPALGMELLECYRPLGQAPIMGVCGQPHYPMPPTLLSQYPMWDVGGLGLGARISNWLNEFGCITPKDLIRRENMIRDYAERRGEIPPGFRLVEPHNGYM